MLTCSEESLDSKGFHVWQPVTGPTGLIGDSITQVQTKTDVSTKCCKHFEREILSCNIVVQQTNSSTSRFNLACVFKFR